MGFETNNDFVMFNAVDNKAVPMGFETKKASDSIGLLQDNKAVPMGFETRPLWHFQNNSLL